MGSFLSKEEKNKLVQVIAEAELNTSGEIRVHLDNSCDENPLDRAAYLFAKLGMHETKLRNAVLIFVSPSDRKLAIVGDKGINEVVPTEFWEDIKDGMVKDFQSKNYVGGLATAIREVGRKLKVFFPYQSDDTNELSNEITEE